MTSHEDKVLKEQRKREKQLRSEQYKRTSRAAGVAVRTEKDRKRKELRK